MLDRNILPLCPECGMRTKFLEGHNMIPFCINCGGDVLTGITGKCYLFHHSFHLSSEFTDLVKSIKSQNDPIIGTDKFDINFLIRHGYVKREIDDNLYLTEFGKWAYHKNKKR